MGERGVACPVSFECFLTGCDGWVTSRIDASGLPSLGECANCGSQYRRSWSPFDGPIELRSWILAGPVQITFRYGLGETQVVTATDVRVAPSPTFVVEGQLRLTITRRELISIDAMP